MSKKVMFVMVLVCAGVLYAVQLGVPAWVHSVFNRGDLALLDRLTHSASPQSLNFYLGRMEELVWGPVVQVLGGLVLILLAVGPLKAVSGRTFFGLILVFLVGTKWEILLYPPYGDAIGGPFAEGWWLARNHFDYVGLFHQPGYAVGGPKVYLTSAFPTYLAVMYTLFPSIKWFLMMNHLVFFAMAAGVAAMIRSIGQRVFCHETAGLLAALVLSWPVFQVQLEAINMELPSLFFAVICAWMIVHRDDRSSRNIHLAGVAALLSLAFKGSGVFACAGFFLFGAIEWFAEKHASRRAAWLGWGTGLMAAAAGSVALKFLTGDQHASAGMIKLLVGWASLRQFPITYFYIANAVFFAAWLWFRRVRHGGFGGLSETERESLRINALMMIFAGMWFLLFLNFLAVSPRYRVAVYPFLLFTLVWTMVRLCSCRWGQMVLLGLAVVALQFNAYGWRNAYIGIDYCLLEENLQYRADLKVYQQLAKAVETRYAGASVVVAPFITAQALAIPDFGYVQAPREVAIYGFNCTYGGIRPYPGIEGLDMARTIYTAMDINQGSDRMPYPLHPNDKVLEVVEWGNRKAWIFMGGFSIDMMKKFQNYLMLKQKAQGVIPGTGTGI